MSTVTKKSSRITLSGIRNELDEQKKFNAYILAHLENIYNKLGDTVESVETIDYESYDELETEINKKASELSVLDIGCGSGILSIAAMLLGAENAVAIDVEENAVKIAKEIEDKAKEEADKIAEQLKAAGAEVEVK